MNRIVGVFIMIWAVIMVSYAIPRAADYKKAQENAGKVMGVVSRVTSDKVFRAGRGHIVYKAIVNYEVNGESYTASIAVDGPSAPEKMIVYYDKNFPDKVLNTPRGIKHIFILSTLAFLTGLAVFVWKRE